MSLAGWPVGYSRPGDRRHAGEGRRRSWLHANGNWQGHRYSTLNQINDGKREGSESRLDIPDGRQDRRAEYAAVSRRNGVFAQDNKVFALNADNGRVVWKFEHKLPDDWGGYNVGFITGKHRGLAIQGENIYFLSNDSKLHALNYMTGKVKYSKDFPGFEYPKDFAKAQDANGYATTVGPLAIPGAIIVPMNGTDFGGRPGYVLGVNPETGDMMWKAAMIPGPGEPGADTWPPGSTEYGGAGPWITGSWDPELKMYYTGTANAYEWNPKNRGGGEMDNVGAASIVAVNTTDGKVAWRYVGVPGDPWDFDIPQTPMVITIDGKKTIVQPNKTGYIHYLDAKTGQFIKATQFIDKINWIKGYDANGRPIAQVPLPKEGGDPVEIYPSLLAG